MHINQHAGDLFDEVRVLFPLLLSICADTSLSQRDGDERLVLPVAFINAVKSRKSTVILR